ncbi:MAG: hypothetical protein Q9225_001872 [Loekoesia sp. 1 TL-2023]
MSPPPRHETEDYWNSRSLHGNKKKHHTRGAGALRTSPLGGTGQSSQASIVEKYDKSLLPPVEATRSTEAEGAAGSLSPSKELKPSTAADTTEQQRWSPLYTVNPSSESQDQPKGNKFPGPVSQQDCSESPAAASLKLLSEVEAEKSKNDSLHSDGTKYSLGGALKSLLTTSDANPLTSKQPDVKAAASSTFSKRRSSALRDGDRRRPKKEDSKAPFSGLGIPATITLRKATGLFQVSAGIEPPRDASAEETVSTGESSLSSPTAFTLIGFGSQQFDRQEQSKSSQEGVQIRKPSVVSTKGQELLLSMPSSKSSGMFDSRRRSVAEPAATVTNIFPSPAIIASPVTSSSPANGPESRFSVVQTKSRNSLHQVIWREDDTSSGSGTCSDHESPTDSVNLPETSENSPVHRSAPASNISSRQNSKITLLEEEEFAPDVLVKNKAESPVNPARPHPEGQMLQWSWGGTAGGPFDLTNSNLVERDPPGSNDKEDRLPGKAPPTGPSFVPRLLIPDDDELAPTPHEPGIARRGSFMVDSPSMTSMTAGRELGSRRSICLQPLTLSSLADLGAGENQNGDSTSRRLSRVG